MNTRFQIFFAACLVLLVSMLLTACLHATQETTCKIKFKKKYDCPFGKISIVEDEMNLGDTIKLRGCGRTVIYDGTKEIQSE